MLIKTKIFTLFVVLLATTNLWAYDFEIDGIYYNITSENTAEVTYKSYTVSWDYRWNESWNIDTVVIPTTVTYNDNIYTVTSIGENAFRECKSLISATLPNSITTILNGAFSDCTGLKLINIPDGVKTIGSNEQTTGAYTSGAFLNCCSLVDITIPNNIVSIEGLAFADCTGLTTITIPNSVTTIYESAFRDVPNVMYSGMAEGYPWGARSVNGYIEGWLVYKDASKSQLLACSSAATDEINLPNSVTSIGERAFYNCTSIFSITIPNSVIEIKDFAFYECSNLNSITIPNSTINIGEFAFGDCTNLTSVVIGNSVKCIGFGAFLFCTSLTSITSYAMNPPICGEHVFENVNKYIPLNVPKESLVKYQIAEYWREFIHINGIEIPSNIENTYVGSETPIKFLSNGQINILNNDKTYTVMGQEL